VKENMNVKIAQYTNPKDQAEFLENTHVSSIILQPLKTRRNPNIDPVIPSPDQTGNTISASNSSQ